MTAKAGGRRRQAGLAALDVEELLGAEIGAEAGFGDDIVGELEGGLRGDDRIAAMGDVGERPAVDEGGVVLERLHEVRLHRLGQQHGHRPVGLDVATVDRGLVAAVADDDVAEPPFEIVDVVGQTQDRHHLGGDGDVEAGLARIAVGDAAQRADDLAQRPVVHVEHPAPDDAADVDGLGVAPVDVVVDHRRQQVVGRGDGVEIAGEVEVDVLHRHDLGVPAAGGAALDAEARAERGLAQAHRRLLADPVEPVAEADGRGRLAFAGRRRVDRGHENQLAVRTVAEARDEVGGDLRLVMAKREQVFVGDAELGADLLDRLLGRGACDFDVGLHGRVPFVGMTDRGPGGGEGVLAVESGEEQRRSAVFWPICVSAAGGPPDSRATPARVARVIQPSALGAVQQFTSPKTP